MVSESLSQSVGRSIERLFGRSKEVAPEPPRVEPNEDGNFDIPAAERWFMFKSGVELVQEYANEMFLRELDHGNAREDPLGAGGYISEIAMSNVAELLHNCTESEAERREFMTRLMGGSKYSP